VCPATVGKWRQRYAQRGLVGLQDVPRPGSKRRYADATQRRVMMQWDQPPPPGYARWNRRLLAEAVVDVSPPAGVDGF
jgi:transposase